MKTNLIYKKPFFLLFAGIIIAGSVLFSACQKDYGMNNIVYAHAYTTAGNASGSQVNPPVTTGASGSLMGTYDTTSKTWQYNISWNGLSDAATAVEIHGPADMGINGTLLFSVSITSAGLSGTASANTTLTAEQQANLLAGKLYYTVIDASHLTGEIRGQIVITGGQ